MKSQENLRAQTVENGLKTRALSGTYNNRGSGFGKLRINQDLKRHFSRDSAENRPLAFQHPAQQIDILG
ncbi:MAG: hypothetical protein VYB45_05095, partial [Pseudomonadota bacterium]|nr:hypothetical protein [Pseudomonadota bacterium]